MVTYVGATFELAGFVLERLNFVRTFLAQIAGSFVALVTPAAVAGAALNIRYLRKANVSPSDAGSSVGVSQVIAFSLHMILLVIFAAFARNARSSLRAPGWVWITLDALLAVALKARSHGTAMDSAPAPPRPQVADSLYDARRGVYYTKPVLRG